MIKNSFFVNIFIVFFTKLASYYESSKSKKIVDKISGFFIRLWTNSLLFHIFCADYKRDVGIENSVIYLSFSKLFAWIIKRLTKTRKSIKESFIINKVSIIASDFFFISIRAYGIMFLALSIVSFLLTQFVGIYQYSKIIILLIMAFSIALLVFSSSLNNLIASSFLANIFSNFLNINLRLREIRKTSYVFWAILGLVFGLAFYYLKIFYFAILFAGFFAFILVFNNIRIGIYATIFLLAIFPTKIIIGLVFLTNLAFLLHLIINDDFKIKFESIDIFVTLMMILYFIASVFSYDVKTSLFIGFSFILYIMFYFVFKSIINTKDELLTAFSVLIVSAALVALFGIVQKHTGLFMTTESWVDTKMFEGLTGRVYATLDNPNMLGEFLMMMMPLCFSMIYYHKKIINKFLAFLVLGLLALCLLYTSSRGAWLATIVAFGVFALFYDRRLIFLFFIAILLMPLFLPDSIISRFTSIGQLSDSSSSYRVSIWLASIAMAKEHFLVGIGVGFEVFMKIYQKYAHSASFALHSHNLYLQILIDLGIFGLINFLIIIFNFFRSSLYSIVRSKDKDLKALMAAMSGAIAGFMVHGMADNTWFNYRLVLFFWLILSFSRITYSLMMEGVKHENTSSING